MKEVQFKHKHAKHTLHIGGKHIKFTDGKATVSDDIADAIIDLEDEDYTVEPLKQVKQEAKPKRKGRAKKR
jgi:hypothetical protein